MKRNKAAICIFLILTLISLTMITGCAHNKSNTVTDSTEIPTESKTSALTGYSDENALILDYIRCLNGDLSLTDFCQAFSIDYTYAHALFEDGRAQDVSEAYELLTDLLAGKYDTDDTLIDFKNEYLRVTENAESPEQILLNIWGENLIDDWRAKFAPFSETIDPERVWHSEFGYSSFHIPVHEEGEYITALNLKYIEKDGKFYWISMGEVW